MRWYFSFGYNFKSLGLSLIIKEESKDDLVGWGYDVAPVLRSVKIHLLFVEIAIGTLIIL